MKAFTFFGFHDEVIKKREIEGLGMTAALSCCAMLGTRPQGVSEAALMAQTPLFLTSTESGHCRHLQEPHFPGAFAPEVELQDGRRKYLSNL